MAVTDLTSSSGQTQFQSSRGGITTSAGANQDPLIGQVLGSFKILAPLGEGGMGRVYLAEHQLIGRRAAIKVLSAEIATNADLVSRFFTEARAVNDIRHPNIVEVTDFGTIGEQPYIVMELLDGETLEQRLATVTALDEGATVRIGAQVAAAVGAGHERGLVHRDLKPANIFLRNHPDYPDFVKVLDFGIAKLLSRERATTHQTEMGVLIGTPAYMSPEQCLGDTHLDHHSDIYSLGVVLYQMVTGRLPFLAESAGRLIMAHVQEPPPPPQSIRPNLSPDLAQAILHAMEKKPERRFSSMREFREALLLSITSATSTSPGGFAPTMATGALAQLLTPPPFVLSPPGAPVPTPMAKTMAVSPSPAIPQPPVVAKAAAPAAPATPPRAPLFTAKPAATLPPPRPVAAPQPANGNRFAPRPANTNRAMPAPSVPASSTLVSTPGKTPSWPGVSSALDTLGTGKAEFVERMVELARTRVSSDIDTPLPVLPKGILHCLDLLNSPDFSFGGMATLLAGDMRLTGQLVQVANNSGQLRTPARNAEQAISRLGAEGTRSALYEIAARPLLETPIPRLQAVFKQPFAHSMAVAILSQRLLQLRKASEHALIEAYRMGLYHDSGRPLVATLLLDLERNMVELKGRKVFAEDIFAAVLDRAHGPASARLARSVGLSEETATAIDAATQPPKPGEGLATILRLANALSHLGGFHTRRDEMDKARATIDEAAHAAGIDENACHRVLAGIKEAVARRL